MLLPRLGRHRSTAAAVSPKGTGPANGAAVMGHGLFFVGHNVSNLLNYAFLLVMSHGLMPADFALFAALFGVVYLASALANTVQTSVAATVAAAGREAGGELVGGAMRRVVLLALPLAAVVFVGAGPVAAFLNSGDTTSVGLTGVAIWLFLIAAVGYGGLQGSGRLALLGAGLIVGAAGRLILGPVFLWLGLGVPGALLGVVLGLAMSAALVAVPFGRFVLRPSMPSVVKASTVVAAFLASVAIAVPTSADVVLAQHYFSGQEAGAYAAVSVLGKVVVFGPLAISLMLFPSLVRRQAEGEETASLLRLALLATAGVSGPLAATVTALGVAAPEITLREYVVPAALLPTYVAAMLAFSLVVTLLYFNLARRNVRFVAFVPLALAAELAAIAVWHPGAISVAVVLLVGNLALLVIGLAVSWRPLLPQSGGSLRLRAVGASALHD